MTATVNEKREEAALNTANPVSSTLLTSSMLQTLRSKFYNKFLKQHEGRQNACWSITVLARRKYYPEFSVCVAMISREILRAETMTETTFLNILDFMEFKASRWIDKNTGLRIPSTACAYYITANALDEKKAYFQHFEFMCNHVKAIGMAGGKLENNPLPLVLTNYKSILEKSQFREYVKLDIDTKDPALIDELACVLHKASIDVVHVVTTRGGYHVLVPCGQDLKSLYEFETKITSKLGKQETWITIESVKGSARLAIPGTYQSDFVPRLVDKDIFSPK